MNLTPWIILAGTVASIWPFLYFVGTNKELKAKRTYYILGTAHNLSGRLWKVPTAQLLHATINAIAKKDRVACARPRDAERGEKKDGHRHFPAALEDYLEIRRRRSRQGGCLVSIVCKADGED